MNKIMVVASLSLALGACGTTTSQRALGGAAIGAGAIAGPIGVGTGAVIGGVVGVITPPEKVNLGKPIWDRK